MVPEKKLFPAKMVPKDSAPLSVLSVLEIYAGARPKELDQITEYLSTFEKLNVDSEIAKLAGEYYQKYKSHNTGLADSIIAATSKIRELTLVTLNKKHFPMIAAVNVPYK
jgi:predicted nucleic acid-binding protein